jgi:hypothetical protein
MEPKIICRDIFRQNYEPCSLDISLCERHWILDLYTPAELIHSLLRNQQPDLDVPFFLRRGGLEAELNKLAYQLPFPAERPRSQLHLMKLEFASLTLLVALAFTSKCVDLQTWPLLQKLKDLS